MRSMNASDLRILFTPGRRLPAETAEVADAAGEARARPGLDLALADWQSDSFPFGDFDRLAETLAADAPGGAFEIRLSGEPRRLAAAAQQVVTRCQRLAARRNAASASELFERVLAGHRRLHDHIHPPAASVHAHALDTWQWLLRLEPEAGLAPQLAALFHDVDRLAAAAGAAIAPGNANAQRRGDWVTDELLAELDVDLAVRVRVHRLIAGRRHPSTAADPFAAEIALLEDADALSFFSFESAAPDLDDLGAEQTARRVAHALARLRPVSRAWLRGLRLRTAVARLLERELARRAVLSTSGGSRAAASAETAGGLLAGTGGTAGASGNCGAAGTVPAGPVRGAKPSRATAIARSRMAAGMAGSAGIARTRTGALLARAAALGALAAAPVRPRRTAPEARPLPGAATAPRSGGTLQRDLAKA